MQARRVTSPARIPAKRFPASLMQQSSPSKNWDIFADQSPDIHQIEDKIKKKKKVVTKPSASVMHFSVELMQKWREGKIRKWEEKHREK